MSSISANPIGPGFELTTSKGEVIPTKRRRLIKYNYNFSKHNVFQYKGDK